MQGEKAARRRGAGEQKHTRGRAGDSRALLPLSHLRRVPIARVQDIVYFAFLLSLFMYIYSMIGMQFFANRLRFDENGFRVRPGTPGYDDAEVPRSHFDTLLWAFTTIFQVLSGENWNSCMYDAWRAVGIGGAVYYISLILFGLFIVMNLFMAILLSNFGVDELDDSEEEEEEKKKPQEEKPAEETQAKEVGEAAASEEADEKQPQEPTLEEEPNAESIFPLDPNRSELCMTAKNPVRLGFANMVDDKKFDNLILVLIIVSSVMLALDSPFNNPDGPLATFLRRANVWLTITFVAEMASKIIAVGFIIRPKSYMRSGWNVLDFGTVIISLIALVVDDPALNSLRAMRALRPIRTIRRIPELRAIIDVLLQAIPAAVNVMLVCTIFFLIFSIVCVEYLKGDLRMCSGDIVDEIIASNEVCDGPSRSLPPSLALETRARTKQAYYELLVDPVKWDALTSEQQSWFGPSSPIWTADGFDGKGFSSANSGCAGGLNASQAAVPTAPCCEAWPTNLDVKPTSWDLCECWGGSWDMVIAQNFDTTPWAMLSLFEIATTEGWVDVMWAACDSRGIGAEPVRDSQENWVWFWMFFMMVGGYLFLNLFVGVTLDQFNKMSEGEASDDEEDDEGHHHHAHHHGNLGLTKAQKEMREQWREKQEWQAACKVMRSVKADQPRKGPRPPDRGCCVKLHDFVVHPYFDNVVMFCIVLNTVTMSMTHFGQEDTFTSRMRICSIVFLSIFTVEAVLKLATFGKSYFRDPWNTFDFIVVATSLILGEILPLLPMLNVDNLRWGSQLIRVLRVGRLLKLVNRLQTMRELFSTLLLTMPALGNITALLSLLFIIFAIVGVQLFGKVAYYDTLDVHINFRTFGNALLSLLRFSTGENWNGFMHAVAHNEDGCVNDPPYDRDMCGFRDGGVDHPGCVPLNGCGSSASYAYFVFFNLTIAFVFLNLFIGVILDGFAASKEQGCAISAAEFEQFQLHWAKFDPEANGFMRTSAIKEFIRTLFAPWGFDGVRVDPVALKRRVAGLYLKAVKQDIGKDHAHPVYEYKEVLDKLVRSQLSHKIEKGQAGEDETEGEEGDAADEARAEADEDPTSAPAPAEEAAADVVDVPDEEEQGQIQAEVAPPPKVRDSGGTDAIVASAPVAETVAVASRPLSATRPTEAPSARSIASHEPRDTTAVGSRRESSGAAVEEEATSGTTLDLSYRTELHTKALAQRVARHLPQAPDGSKLHTLILDGSYLGDEGAEDVARALERKHTALRTLRCFYCGVRNRGAQAIARVLPATRLSRLDLTHNEVGAEGVNALADAISEQPSSRHRKKFELNLSDNQIIAPRGESSRAGRRGDPGGAIHALCALVEALDARGGRIGLAVANIGLAASGDAAVDLMRKLGGSGIEVIDLSGNGLGDAACVALAEGLRARRGEKRPPTRVDLRVGTSGGGGDGLSRKSVDALVDAGRALGAPNADWLLYDRTNEPPAPARTATAMNAVGPPPVPGPTPDLPPFPTPGVHPWATQPAAPYAGASPLAHPYYATMPGVMPPPSPSAPPSIASVAMLRAQVAAIEETIRAHEAQIQPAESQQK